MEYVTILVSLVLCKFSCHSIFITQKHCDIYWQNEYMYMYIVFVINFILMQIQDYHTLYITKWQLSYNILSLTTVTQVTVVAMHFIKIHCTNSIAVVSWKCDFNTIIYQIQIVFWLGSESIRTYIFLSTWCCTLLSKVMKIYKAFIFLKATYFVGIFKGQQLWFLKI